MSDFAWLNHIPVPTFAFQTVAPADARILFWNDAMEIHSNVASELATTGKLATLSQRLLRAAERRAKTASLGSLGVFELNAIGDNTVIAALSPRAEREFEDEKVMFLAMAAHDLRSPLRHIRGLLDEVREGFNDMGDGKLELLNMMEEINERARLFTDDVITYTWATHVQKSETTRIDLFEMVNDIFQSVDPAQKHALNCPGMILDTDRLALQITLRNLLDNAVRHGGKASMSITLQVEALDAVKLVRFTVVDDGKGLASPADFFVSATDLRKSSSFGLMGVKRLIEERGGEISAVEPEDDTGSAITFTLPGTIETVQEARAKAG